MAPDERSREWTDDAAAPRARRLLSNLATLEAI
jgi:hypothetical protein